MDAVAKPEIMAEDSDEEDLEALRLAALQSIKNKPTVVVPRRRPKPVGRPNRKRTRNFFRGCVNTNLISIVPLEIPLDQGETSSKSVDPPPLVLPQDRYSKTEVKEEIEEKEISVPSKFSRFEDSNSGDSDDDYEEEFGNQSSEEEKQCEASEKNDKMDDDSVADDDELLLQDEDSLGKFFNEFELEPNETEPERMKPSSVGSNPVKSDRSRSTSKLGENPEKEKRLGADASDVKGSVDDESLTKKNSESKSATFCKRPFETHESKQSKSGKLYLRDASPLDEDIKRINRPCIFGRNRSPSPLPKGKQFEKFQQYSKRIGRRHMASPKGKTSSLSPESLSPLRKRELHQHKVQLASGKSSQSAQSGNSPREITPPSHWGSRSDSSHGFSHTLNTRREWSSSPLKMSGSTAPTFLIESPNKNISPSRQRRRSKSPVHKSSRIWGSSERDWSGSPQHRRSRDFDTPPDSLRSTTDVLKAVKRKSTSPVTNLRVAERSRHGERSTETALSPRRTSPTKHLVHSPSKIPRRSSPVQSSSRTPSLSPSPEPQGKSSTGNYRRYKSPLRLPGYRPQNHRDARTFRSDGKINRKDGDRQRTIRLNGPPRKGSDSKIEMSKVRPFNVRLEAKLDEPSPPKKSEVERDPVQLRSPNSAALPSSWSSEEGESDSESRFKGTDSKGVKPVIIPSKLLSSAVPRVKELEETSSSEKRSPKKKKSKHTKKSFIKDQEVDVDEPKEKQTNDVDLRAELSRRRAERVNKAKNILQNSMPVRLLQSAFQGLTSKPNPIDGERNNVNAFPTKSEVSSDASVSKKKPIHLRLGLPVARNPDPPEPRLAASCPLPRISGCEKKETPDPIVDGGNKLRKVKLKRSVTVQKSLPRGTSSSVTNTSGKEQST